MGRRRLVRLAATAPRTGQCGRRSPASWPLAVRSARGAGFRHLAASEVCARPPEVVKIILDGVELCPGQGARGPGFAPDSGPAFPRGP